MARQIPSSPSNKPISEIIGLIRRGELILQPEFQRKFVWNSTHMESFIDTILNGFPFPEIYVALKGIDLDTLKGEQVVVDGQQRLSTILKYLEDDGSDPNFGKKIRRYKELSDVDQRSFLNYNVVFRDLQDIEPEMIKEVFRRINQTKFSLNQIEISNAIYDGEFITAAKEILDVNSDKLEKLSIFSDSEIDRMGDLNFILILMATYEEGGYYSGRKSTEEYIVKFNDAFEQKDSRLASFNSVFNTIIALDLPVDSMWFRKSNFFTLTMELLWNHNLPENLKYLLDNFERSVLEAKGNQENDFGKYYSYMYSGTNSRNARVERGRLFKKYILNLE